MRYQHLAFFGIAALGAAASVSASPLFQRDDNAQCPPGYTMSVYYITVTAEPTTTIQATSTVTDTVTVTPEASTITSTPAETSAAAPAEPTSVESQVAAVETSVYVEAPVPSSTSSTKEAVVVPTVPVVEPTSSTVAPRPTTTAAAPTTSKAQKPTTQAAAPSTSTSTSSSSSSGPNSGSTSGETYSGEATYYGGNIAGGTCSFSGYTLPSDLFGTAFSGAQWNDAAECGACVQVTGPAGNTIKAMIVDKCPECAPTHLDLFENAFSTLAAPSKGIIDINWSYVSCGIDSPIQLKNKEGTSQYWFSMQVVNANEPVTALEVSTDGGNTWTQTTRSFYNFFENESGFGTETVDVRVTGKSGKTVRVNGVSCASGEVITGSGNF